MVKLSADIFQKPSLKHYLSSFLVISCCGMIILHSMARFELLFYFILFIFFCLNLSEVNSRIVQRIHKVAVETLLCIVANVIHRFQLVAKK